MELLSCHEARWRAYRGYVTSASMGYVLLDTRAQLQMNNGITTRCGRMGSLSAAHEVFRTCQQSKALSGSAKGGRIAGQERPARMIASLVTICMNNCIAPVDGPLPPAAAARAPSSGKSGLGRAVGAEGGHIMADRGGARPAKESHAKRLRREDALSHCLLWPGVARPTKELTNVRL